MIMQSGPISNFLAISHETLTCGVFGVYLLTCTIGHKTVMDINKVEVDVPLILMSQVSAFISAV
jgi:hypothetical protein